MLKIRFKDKKYNAVWLVEPKITIGRSATNALVIDDPIAGDVHVEVLVDNENLTLKNLLPAVPVKVNDLEVTGACELKPEDQITIGTVELVVIDPKRETKTLEQAASNVTQLRPSKPTGWSLKANHTALGNRVFPLKDITVIGRANDCDISLAAAHLSRRHAQLQVVDGMLFVKDLGSANGTFLNGKQVSEARVKRGDELRFDALSFGVIGPSDDMAKTSVRKPPSRAEAIQEAKAAPVAKGKPAQRPSPVVPTRASSASTPVSDKVAEAGSKGRYGLIFLGILAVLVITALFLTRK
ncbi:FHA domain-containing protein [Cellvibrio japonicus]|uniref:FHA domain protein n=1 Tax=Cellvibrio japonicus (strain Ueda107) TaxID=498211 RepID=B3PFU6_CELJU|nr:FHA domain-containing protein [Cellvibrio japonicus]ACE82801.1 FHA domain protein [Cellvibrio japonicus Ueda107]QEI12311.1 FHA domain-containing protein [Cellvibrio japonicus]QEI15884.1 FHA domain-containing protein [Cellvibrio japonicus]QEI19463.1 FHA domain-containing protein [Cellvibrio japonicus]